MNMETLKPFEPGTDRAIENGKKGGLKSAETKRNKKLFKEVIKELLNQEINKDDKTDLIKRYPNLDIESISIRTLLLDKQIQKALKGDTKACDFILNVSGEKPKEDDIKDTILPVIKVDIVDNTELEKEFQKYQELDELGQL